MAGEPAETMIGVSAIGFGAVLLFAAYKNISPIAIIRNAVTNGSIDFSALPPLVSGGIKAIWHVPPATDKAIADIAVKDPGLAASIKKEISTFDSNTPQSATSHFRDLMAQARNEGFVSQANTIEAYINELVKPASTGLPGGINI